MHSIEKIKKKTYDCVQPFSVITDQTENTSQLSCLIRRRVVKQPLSNHKKDVSFVMHLATAEPESRGRVSGL